MKNILILLLSVFFSAFAMAQTSPGLVNGQVPTAAQWNSYFASKMDYSALGTCDGSNQALTWSSTIGFGCNTITTGGGGSPGGATSDVQYNSAGVLAGNAGLTYDGSDMLSLGVAGTSSGKIQINGATSGSITLVPVTGALGTSILTVPASSSTLATTANIATAIPSATTSQLYGGTGVAGQTGTIALGTDLSITSGVLNATTTTTALPVATTSQLYGGTGSAGTAQAITLGTNLTMSGSTLNAAGTGGSFTPPVTIPGATLSDPRVAIFGTLPLNVGAAQNANASLFSVQSTINTAYSDAVIALGHLMAGAAGGAIAPIYIECATDVAGVCEGMEIDTFNNAGTAYASLTPPNRSIGTPDIIPQGLILSAGSRTGYSGNSWAATDVESNTALWYVGNYVNPAAIMSTGYLFAGANEFTVAQNGTTTINVAGTLGTSIPALQITSQATSGLSGGQIRMINSYSGVPTPSKSLRIDASGNFQIVNDAYTSAILSLTDSGNLSVVGSITTAGSPVATSASIAAALPSATTSQLYGGTGSAGTSQAITLGTGLSMSGSTLNSTGGSSFPLSTNVSGAGHIIDNVIIGNSIPLAGNFTSITASSSVSGAGVNALFASPPAIGGSSPAAGHFTSLSAAGDILVTPPTSTGAVAALAIQSTSTDHSDGAVVTLTNTGGVSTPNKSFRIDGGGNFQILNSAFSAAILTLSDTGGLTLPLTSGTAATYACFTSSGLLISSASPC